MKRIILYVLLAFPLFIQSCLREQTAMCESWLLLRFRYTLNNQYTNLFGNNIHKVTVYVFDDEGKYVNTFSEQGEHLTNDYVMRIPLSEGKYSVVAYGGDFKAFSTGELSGQGNTLSGTLRKGLTDLNDFRTELKNTGGEGDYLYPSLVPDDFYAGFVTDAVAMVGNQKVTEVELMKDTKQVIVRITNTSPVTVQSVYAAAQPFDVSIMALNGRYLADNNVDLNHGTFKYTPVNMIAGTDFVEAELKIMRLMLGQVSRLVIKNSLTSEVIYNENMIDQILLNPKYKTQTDFDREDRFIFEIGIQTDGNHVRISVVINGWKINHIIPDN